LRTQPIFVAQSFCHRHTGDPADGGAYLAWTELAYAIESVLLAMVLVYSSKTGA